MQNRIVKNSWFLISFIASLLPFTCRLDFLSNHPSSSDSNDKLRREVGKSGSFLDDMTIFTLHITTTHYCTVSAQCTFLLLFSNYFYWILTIYYKYFCLLFLIVKSWDNSVSSLIIACNLGWWNQTKKLKS